LAWIFVLLASQFTKEAGNKMEEVKLQVTELLLHSHYCSRGQIPVPEESEFLQRFVLFPFFSSFGREPFLVSSKSIVCQFASVTCLMFFSIICGTQDSLNPNNYSFKDFNY
jgi:hypothetical protein